MISSREHPRAKRLAPQPRQLATLPMRRFFRHIALAATALGAFAALSAIALPAHPAGGSEGGSHANQGYLGVSLRDLSKDDLASLPPGIHGTEIVHVDHDGPAGKAGLRENDVILQLNGQAIGGHDQLKHLLHDVAPGQTVSLLIFRDGQQVTVSTELETREAVEHRAWEQHIAAQAGAPSPSTPSPAAPAPSGFFHSPFADASHRTHSLLGGVLGSPYTGVALEPITPQLGTFFGVEGGSGLLVRSVEPNSPGAVANLRAGDVILSVNGVAVTSENDWAREVHDSKGRAVPVALVRDHHPETVTLLAEGKHKSRLVAPPPPFASRPPAHPASASALLSAPVFSVRARSGS